MTSLWLILITVLGCGLRFFELGQEPLWTDEGFTWLWIHLDHSRIWGDAGQIEYNSPFYYSLQRLWLMFGDTEFAMRSFSALLGTATIPVVFLIGRTVASSGVGLVAALLLATQPVHVAYSQEARVYALLCFGGALAILGLVGFLRASAGPAGAWNRSPYPFLATYAVGVLLCLHSHNTGIFVPVLASAAAFAWWLGPARLSARFAALWVAANVLAAAPWLFWLPVVVHQALESGVAEGLPHYTQPDPVRALFEAARMLGVRYIPDHRLRILQALSLVPLLACMALLLRRSERLLLSVLAICGFGLPALAFAIGYVVRPVYNDRILIWFIPPLLVLAAAAIRGLPRPWLRSATLSATLLLQLGGLGLPVRHAAKGALERPGGPGSPRLPRGGRGAGLPRGGPRVVRLLRAS